MSNKKRTRERGLSCARYVTELSFTDPRTGVVTQMEVYRHENGGMFAVDSSFIEQMDTDDSDVNFIPDIFNDGADVLLC